MGNYKPYPFKIPFTRPVTIPFKRPFDVPDDCILCLIPEIRTKWFDQSINGFDATIYNCEITNGRFGMGLLFNNDDSYTEILNLSGSGLLTAAKGTMGIWVKSFEVIAVTQMLFLLSGYKPVIALNNGDLYTVWSGSTDMGGAGGNRTNKYSLSLNTWHLIIFKWDTGTYWLKLDDVELETTTGCTFTATGGITTYVGGDNTANSRNNCVDEAWIFNRKTTDEEDTRLYDIGKPEG